MLIRNILAGIAKGIGIGIGFSFINSCNNYNFAKIVTLNIPVIGDYITDIVEIVDRNRK